MTKSLLYASILLLGTNVAFPLPAPRTQVVRSYPLNGARYVHPATSIGITFSEPLSLNPLIDSIAVFGAGEKRYLGKLRLSSNRRTLIFTPSEQFQRGEEIHARIGSIQTASGNYTDPYSLAFSVRDKIANSDRDFHSDDPVFERQLHPENFSFIRNSIPAAPYDTLPAITILKNDNPSDGYMYIANYTWQSIQPLTYGIVLDKNGNVKNVMGNGSDYYNDFKPHPDGTYSFFDAIKNKFFISDTGFSIIDSIVAPAAYITDGHELRITSDNNYWFIGIDYIIMDMSQVVDKGKNTAVIVTPIILEYDSDKNLIFEWRTIDHFQITDATYEDLLSAQIDFCHVNSIAFDTDSNLLLSCRHMDEVTKIGKETGDIMWRWGGKNNQFRLVGDTMMFSHQHAVRRTTEGTYTMMDNGNFHDVAVPFSRALEFRLDQNNKIATEIWHFRHSPDVYSGAMGFVQRLPNKSTFIGWGECDSLSITEVDSNNVVRFDMLMPGGTYSYRAFKFDSNYVIRNLEAVQNYSSSSIESIACIPNPFNAAAKIEYTIAKGGYASLSLYDALGREINKVYSGFLSEGTHEFQIDAKNLSGGVYYLRANLSGASSADGQIVVLK